MMTNIGCGQNGSHFHAGFSEQTDKMIQAAREGGPVDD
jgi:hypothetical protein